MVASRRLLPFVILIVLVPELVGTVSTDTRHSLEYCDATNLIQTRNVLKPATTRGAAKELISDIAASRTRPHSEEEKRSEAVFEWARQNGAIGLDHIRVNHFDKGAHSVRGLAAAHDLKKGLEISIPKSILLSAEHPLVKSSPMRNMGNQYLLRHHFPTKLIVYFAAEHRKLANAHPGENVSFWQPLIESYPTPEDYARFYPKYASDELLATFSAIPMISMVKEEKNELQHVWNKRKSEFVELAQQAGADGLSFDDFKWADTALKTRVYKTDEGVMVIPISDMANTGPKCNWDWSGALADKKAFTLTLPHDLSEGDELLDEYHDTTNDIMLRIYGFMMKDNPNHVELLDSVQCLRLQEPLSFNASEDSQPMLFVEFQSLAREHCPPS